jgi:alpha-methylacyl-CoA racemase
VIENKGARPLDGIKVIEMAGLAPSPFCGMMLSDFGADVVVLDRVHSELDEHMIMPMNPFDFGKPRIRVNLKTKDGVEIIRNMIRKFDVLVEPYRPGVMESLDLGPEQALSDNPRLIYARVTGWGQDGVLAHTAGHDMNYIGLSGALSLFRRKGEKPVPPCNVLGDFAAGGMFCAIGILLALIERGKSGKGQVVDAAILDGSVYLSTLFYGLIANNLMSMDIGTNILDGGAPYYQVYETRDGKYMAVASIESKFYAQLLECLGLNPSFLPKQNDTKAWPEMIRRFAAIFLSKTRGEWEAVFAGKDACVSPVLELDEVGTHPHNKERGILTGNPGFVRPSPAPKLSRTPARAAVWESAPKTSQSRQVLNELGYSEEQIGRFFENEIVA